MVAGDGMVAERADLIVRNAKVTTLGDGRGAAAEAVAARGERFAAVGDEAEVMRLAGRAHGWWARAACGSSRAQRLAPARDPRRLALQPGAALGGGSAAWRGLEMIREQADRTPQGQWVRVMGGWSPYQFTEKADADRGGAEQGGSAGARAGPVRLQPGAAGRAGTAAPRLSAASAPPRGHCEFADGGGSACVISQSLLSGRRSTRPPRERANPRANAGRHQATPSYARRLSSLVKCPLSDTEPRPATPRT